MLPTLIDICQLQTPERGHLKFDGRSLAPLLKDENAEWKDRLIINHVQNIVDKQIKDKNSIVYTERWRLINKKELNDIKADPGQQNNIADLHPDVVANLSKKYDDYWNELEMDNYPYPRPIIGTEYKEETWLNTISWIRSNHSPHSWNQRHILAGDSVSGFWPVEISKSGLYQFEVRRWPKELNHPIRAALPADSISDITCLGQPVFVGEGKAIPAVRVRLRVSNQKLEKGINKSNVSALFDLKLPAGETIIQAWLVDANGNEQSAYYVNVRLLE